MARSLKVDGKTVRGDAASALFGEAMIKLGRPLVPEYEKLSEGIMIHPKLLEAIAALCDHLKFRDEDKTPEPKRFLVSDPWDKVTKRLGFNFPRKGMSTYFMIHVAVMSILKSIKGTEYDMEALEFAQRLMKSLIEEMAGDLENAEFAAMLYTVMGPDFERDGERLSSLLSQYHLGEAALATGKLTVHVSKEILAVNVGYLRMLETMIPDNPSGIPEKVGTFIWRTANSATSKDFVRAREIANKFLEGSGENSIVMELLTEYR